MRYILLIIIIALFISLPCSNFFKSKSNIYYSSRNAKISQILDTLRTISLDVSNKIPTEYGNILKHSLKYTTFVELRDNDRLLGWNYDYGREIGIRIYAKNNNPYKTYEILSFLFHELAHSINKEDGHGKNFQKIDKILQKYVPIYVKTLLNNTCLKE